ncbi:UNVERIFIED_CONTAM: hypothetical protein Sindi_1847000 [Sesamum indicum]
MGKSKGKGKNGGSKRSRANDVCIHCCEKGYWKREYPQLLFIPGYGAHIFNDLQVLERSRRLSKDKMIQGSMMIRLLM